MPIDLSAVNWIQVALFTGFAFLAAVIGNLIAFKRRFLGALLTAVIFAVIYFFWTYYPHGLTIPGLKG